jgi:NADH-quinone oxidoreductase subunit A
MEAQSTSLSYLPIIFQIVVALGFVVLTMTITHLIGPKRKTADKLVAFESGIKSIGNARQPFSIKYFLVAILFVLFDVEVIFMYPWAVNFREFGMNGLIEMFIFMGTLLLGFIYIIKKGALDWD